MKRVLAAAILLAAVLASTAPADAVTCRHWCSGSSCWTYCW